VEGHPTGNLWNMGVAALYVADIGKQKSCWFRPPSAASIPTGPERSEPGNSLSVGSGEGPGNWLIRGRFSNF